jgi:hypothetical protein
MYAMTMGFVDTASPAAFALAAAGNAANAMTQRLAIKHFIATSRCAQVMQSPCQRETQ